MHKLAIGAAAWVALAGMYLLLAGEVSAIEVGAAVFSATLGTTLVLATHHFGTRQFRFRPATRAVLSPLATLLPDTVAVGRELVSAAIYGGGRMRGEFLYQPFKRGGDEPRSQGRRALAVLGLSLTPRSFVIRESDDALLLHALPPKRPSDDKVWPA